MGGGHGFEVEPVPVVEFSGKPVSSTRIRALVAAGEVLEAKQLLGAPFCVTGEVVPGHGRGKGLGFATANIRWETMLIPAEGVYAALAYWDQECRPAVVNIGANPTFGDGELAIEAHVMGFSGDLYQKQLRIAYFKRLRGERKFDGPESLVAQIKKDVAHARETLLAETGKDHFAAFAGDGERVGDSPA